jgi:CheY-like chemotaxis protein
MRTVDMILNVSRLQAGEYILKPSRVNIPELVRNVVANHSRFAEQKHLLLTSTDECDSAIVMVDEYCITQAMNNLLNNAIKFTAAGEVAVRVFKDPTGQVNISCRDTGIGIAPSYFPTLFSRYSQEQSGFTRPFEGLGLGMALVKEYLTLNNATVSVESEKGSGTTFTVTFQNGGSPTHPPITGEQPAGAASTTELLRTPLEQRPGSGNASAAFVAAHTTLPPRAERRHTVLLIEDDEMTIHYMKTVLKSKWELLTAHDSVEAWEVLYRSPVDIILMDVSLSGEQTGIELTHDIRQSKAHGSIPIIAVTAYAYDSDRERCLEAGCNEFIRKPIVRASLLDSMERLLAR